MKLVEVQNISILPIKNERKITIQKTRDKIHEL